MQVLLSILHLNPIWRKNLANLLAHLLKRLPTPVIKRLLENEFHESEERK